MGRGRGGGSKRCGWSDGEPRCRCATDGFGGWFGLIFIRVPPLTPPVCSVLTLQWLERVRSRPRNHSYFHFSFFRYEGLIRLCVCAVPRVGDRLGIPILS